MKAVEVAKKLGVDAFCHGCTGKGNDQFRFEFVFRTFMPDTPIIAPMREHTMTRTWEIEYAETKGIPIGQSKHKIWSIDENLWGRSHRGRTPGGAELRPAGGDIPVDQEPGGRKADPDRGHYRVRERRAGGDRRREDEPAGPDPQGCIRLPVRTASAAWTSWRTAMMGLKVRENYECPAAKLLIPAHKALEALVCTAEERAFKVLIDQKWGQLAYAGLWFDPFKDDLEAFINAIQPRVTGTVTLRLFKGSCQVIGRASKYALYNEDLASFDSKTFDQSEAIGIVKTHGMQARMYHTVKDN